MMQVHTAKQVINLQSKFLVAFERKKKSQRRRARVCRSGAKMVLLVLDEFSRKVDLNETSEISEDGERVGKYWAKKTC